MTGLELPGDAGVDAHAQDRGADRGYPRKQQFEPLVVIGVDSALAANLVVVDEIKDRASWSSNVASRMSPSSRLGCSGPPPADI